MKAYHISKIPEATIKRLSIYIRCLRKMEEQGTKVVSSQDLANICCVTSAQIRKDLSYFGEFGVRGVGYDIRKLQDNIKNVLGLNKVWRVIIVGVGNLGRALLHYPSFEDDGYRWVGAFDVDKKIIGEKLNEEIVVEDFNKINESKIKELNPDFAVITTPAEVAQDVVDKLIEFGITCFLNFAPVKIKVDEFQGIVIKNVFTRANNTNSHLPNSSSKIRITSFRDFAFIVD
jgi:redox-sensing transcriptional repressor